MYAVTHSVPRVANDDDDDDDDATDEMVCTMDEPLGSGEEGWAGVKRPAPSNSETLADCAGAPQADSARQETTFLAAKGWMVPENATAAPGWLTREGSSYPPYAPYLRAANCAAFEGAGADCNPWIASRVTVEPSRRDEAEVDDGSYDDDDDWSDDEPGEVLELVEPGTCSGGLWGGASAKGDATNGRDEEPAAAPPLPKGSPSAMKQSAEGGAEGVERSPLRRKGVRFGDVQVLHHDVRLDGSKMPSDGLAPVGVSRRQLGSVRRAAVRSSSVVAA